MFSPQDTTHTLTLTPQTQPDRTEFSQEAERALIECIRIFPRRGRQLRLAREQAALEDLAGRTYPRSHSPI